MALRKHCDHCGTEIDRAPLDIAAVEPVAKAWPGGNLAVRVVLTGAITTRADEYPDRAPERWTRLDLCQPCFEYVLSEATAALVSDWRKSG